MVSFYWLVYHDRPVLKEQVAHFEDLHHQFLTSKASRALPHIKCACLFTQLHLSLFTRPTQKAEVE